MRDRSKMSDKILSKLLSKLLATALMTLTMSVAVFAKESESFTTSDYNSADDYCQVILVDGMEVTVTANAGVLPDGVVAKVTGVDKSGKRDIIQEGARQGGEELPLRIATDIQNDEESESDNYDVTSRQVYAVEVNLLYEDENGNIKEFETSKGGVKVEIKLPDEIYDTDGLFSRINTVEADSEGEEVSVSECELIDDVMVFEPDGNNTFGFEVVEFEAVNSASGDEDYPEYLDLKYDMMQRMDPEYFKWQPFYENTSDTEYLYIKNITDEVVSTCGGDTYEQVRKLMWYLYGNVSYDYEALNSFGFGAVVRPYDIIAGIGTDAGSKTICQGYANTLWLMMQQLNIPSTLLTGENHAFNAFYCEETSKWYIVDACWGWIDKKTETSKWSRIIGNENHEVDFLHYVLADGIYYSVVSGPNVIDLAKKSNTGEYEARNGIYSIDNDLAYDIGGAHEAPKTEDISTWKVYPTDIADSWKKGTFVCKWNDVKVDFSRLDVADENKITKMIYNTSSTTVPQRLCYGLTYLEELTLNTGGKITGIEYAAFQDCEKLKKINGSFDTLTVMEANVFAGCKAYDPSGFITNKLTTIGDAAFAGSKLSSVNITGANGLTIGTSAFKGCEYLKNVTISDSGLSSVRSSLGESIFEGCSALEKLDLSGNKLSAISSNDLTGCSSIREIDLSDNEIGEIGTSAFMGLNNLEKVDLTGNSLATIGNKAFSSCGGLKEVKMSSEELSVIDSYAFSGCSELTGIDLRDSKLTEISENCFSGCTNLEEVLLPNGIKKINQYAFSEDGNLVNTRFDKLSDIESIGEKAFYNCSKVSDIDFANAQNLVVIGISAFEGCKKINNIDLTMANSTKAKGLSIASKAFYGCTGVTSLVLPANVEIIGEEAFYDNTSLSDITFRGAKPTLGGNAFSVSNPSLISSKQIQTNLICSFELERFEKLRNFEGRNVLYESAKDKLATPVITSIKKTDDGVEISWNPVPGVVNYVVKRKKGDSAGNFEAIGSVSVNKYVDNGTSENYIYSYVVQAIADISTKNSVDSESKLYVPGISGITIDRSNFVHKLIINGINKSNLSGTINYNYTIDAIGTSGQITSSSSKNSLDSTYSELSIWENDSRFSNKYFNGLFRINITPEYSNTSGDTTSFVCKFSHNSYISEPIETDQGLSISWNGFEGQNVRYDIYFAGEESATDYTKLAGVYGNEYVDEHFSDHVGLCRYYIKPYITVEGREYLLNNEDLPYYWFASKTSQGPAIKNIVATIVNGEVILSWSALAEVNKYELYQSGGAKIGDGVASGAEYYQCNLGIISNVKNKTYYIRPIREVSGGGTIFYRNSEDIVFDNIAVIKPVVTSFVVRKGEYIFYVNGDNYAENSELCIKRNGSDIAPQIRKNDVWVITDDVSSLECSETPIEYSITNILKKSDTFTIKGESTTFTVNHPNYDWNVGVKSINNKGLVLNWNDPYCIIDPSKASDSENMGYGVFRDKTDEKKDADISDELQNDGNWSLTYTDKEILQEGIYNYTINCNSRSAPVTVSLEVPVHVQYSENGSVVYLTASDKNSNYKYSWVKGELVKDGAGNITDMDYSGPAVVKEGDAYYSARTSEESIMYRLTVSDKSTDAVLGTEYFLVYGNNCVVYELNGGTNNAGNSKLVSPKTGLVLADPEKPGYKFQGWYKDSEFNDRITEIPAGSFGKMTIYAKWKEQYATADVKANPYGVESEYKTVNPGDRISLSSNTLGSVIYYTLNDTVGTTLTKDNLFNANGTLRQGMVLYENPVVLSEELAKSYAGRKITIYAISAREGYKSSNVTAFKYQVADKSRDWGQIGYNEEDPSNPSVSDMKELTGDTVSDEDLNNKTFDAQQYIPKTLWVAGIPENVDFTGSAITFENLHVYYYKTLLKAGTDYTVKYSNNVKAGTAKVTITGKGNYAGTITRQFIINPLSLGNATESAGANSSRVTAPDVTCEYNGKVQKASTVVTYLIDSENSKYVTLKNGTDYTLVYARTDKKRDGDDYSADAFKLVGNYIVQIVGKGNYTGSAVFMQTIAEKSSTTTKLLTRMKFAGITTQWLTGQAVKPGVTITDGQYTLVKDVDYTLSYQNNVAAGTATVIVRGIDNEDLNSDGVVYSGSKVVTFKIAGLPMSKVKVTGIENFDFANKPVEQNIFDAETGRGFKLVFSPNKNTNDPMQPKVLESGEDFDYEVSYENNINAGKKATIIFTGINRYSGVIKKTFTINPLKLAADNVKIGNVGANGSFAEADSFIYRKGGVKPSVNVTCVFDGSPVTLKEGVDYTVKYSNNTAVNDGTNAKKLPTVTITGKGNYTGSVSRTFTITASSLSNASMTVGDVVYAKKAGICKPVVSLYDTDGVKLVAGKDYDKNPISITYDRDVVVTHIDKKKNETQIEKEENTPVDLVNDVIPSGTEIRVTMQGIGYYAGSTQEAVFRFVNGDIAKANVRIIDQEYTGEKIEPDKSQFTVTMGSGRNAVTLGSLDYEIISYSNNVAKGTARAIIRGKGNYGGEKSVTFKIVAKSMNYLIHYDNNDGTKPGYAPAATGTMKDSQVTAGGALTKAAFKRNGYVFAGWNTRADGSGESYSDRAAFSIGSSLNSFRTIIFGNKITLYAQWTPVTYKITYNLNGGKYVEGVTYPVSYNISGQNTLSDGSTMGSGSFIIPDGIATKEGYVFAGWYKEKNFRTVVNQIDQGTINNIVLYAKWNKQ